MNNKKFIKIINSLFKPAIIITIILSIATLIHFLNLFDLQNHDLSNKILKVLDLNKEGTIAIWFAIFIWIICGLSFSTIGFSSNGNYGISKSQRILLIFSGLFICLVSFDKIFHFHLMIDLRVINILGIFSPSLRKDSPYYWLFLIIIPAFIYIFISIILVYIKLIKGIKKNELRKTTLIFLFSALICIPLEVGLDMLQGFYWYEGQKHTIFNSFEAMVELAGVLCFMGANKTIMRYYSS